MERFSNLLIGAGSALFAGSLFFNSCTYTVDAGEKAIIFDKFRGLQEEIIGEGLHLYIPYIQSPVKYEVRVRDKTIASSTGTKDLQVVNITLRVLHRPISDYLPAIHQNLGKDYENLVLPSFATEVLKSVVAQYDADQLLKKREAISNEIKENLTNRAKSFNIALDDVSIIQLGFMREYAQAIEHKQVASQLAERQRFIVQRDEEEKTAQIIRSEGEAESARLINESVKTFGAAQLEIKRLEAAKSIAESLAKSPNITFVPNSGSGLLLNLRA